MNTNITLQSGYQMPILGLGTWQNTGSSCKESIITALNMGYRHIDTALMYQNHREIAQALQEVSIPREELFITSKIWFDDLSYQGVLSQVEKILEELKIDYLDLCLIHWPNSDFDMKDSFEAFSHLVKTGVVKSVGVSNFTINHLKEAIEKSPVSISVNQVEFHPYLYQKELLDFCKENDIVLTAYSPMGRGEVLEDETIQDIARGVGKTPSQVVLRWLIQQNIVVIPKAASYDHQKENFEIFDFELDEPKMNKISQLNRNYRIINPSFAEFNK